VLVEVPVEVPVERSVVGEIVVWPRRAGPAVWGFSVVTVIVIARAQED
jgi:hypothetical protein